MAHALRYYKEITHADGKVIRIEFHEKNGTADAKELGDVIQSLCLDLQGGGDIDEPIVKTMLNFTLVDAPDHEDAKIKKCGAWEEFYSPDATHWKVLLLRKNGNSFEQFWGGYITPDSYRESLTYRSGVSFIARDNIGHLQDFPFDATGNAESMISLYDLIEDAWRKIESPMQITNAISEGAAWLKCENTTALYTYMNVSAFEGMSWFEALESALYGYGLVMRYIGDNKVGIFPLRNLPLYGKSYNTIVNPVFQTGAERELSPAVKRIEESVSYTLEETITRPLVKINEYSGAAINVEYEGKDTFGAAISGTAKVNPLSKRSGLGWSNPNTNATLLLNPKAYDTTSVKEYLASDMLFLLNTKGANEVVYSAAINPQDLNIRLAFGQIFEIYGTSLRVTWFNSLDTIKYALSAEQNGITQYWNGSAWETTKTELSANFENGAVVLNCNARKFSGEVTLGLHIYKITRSSKISTENAVYASLNGMTFISAEATPMLTTNRVNTNYLETNNVTLSREPKIAPAMNTPFVPAIIKNGIFRKDGSTYVAADLWSWDGTGKQQMAVYNHLQLLCYYAKPNNVISGTILNADVTDFAKLYRWNGVEHLLVSGTLNLISGYIENASLRGFEYYDEMWGELTDAADFPQVDGGSKTTAESGAQSAQAATYSNTTNVTIGGEGGGTIVLDTFMSDSSTNGVQNKVIKAYVDSVASSISNELATKAKQSDLVATDARVKTIEDWKGEKDNFFAKFYLKDGDIYCDTNLIVSGESATFGSGNPSTGQGIDKTGLENYLKEYKYINQDALLAYDYATEDYVDVSIANLINGAPTTLDTLKEIADAFAESKEVVEALDNAIGKKADADKVYTKEQIDDEFEDYETALATKAKQSDLVITNENVAANANNITTLTNNKADKTALAATDAKVKANEDEIADLKEWKGEKDNFFAKFYLKDGDIYCDTNLIVSGESATRGAGDPSTGGGLDENRLAEYLDEYKYINEDALLGYGYLDENGVARYLGLNGYVKEEDINDFATESYVDNAVRNKADKGTKLADYGITDAKIVNGVITLGNATITPITSHQSLAAYATKDYVTEQIGKIDIYTDEDVEKLLGAKDYINEGNFASYGIATTDDVLEAMTSVGLTVDNKVDKVTGKGLSTNDFTDALLNKLNGIDANAQVNVQSDWNATSGDAFIKNKPTLGSLAAKNSLDYSEITNTPTLAAVALSGKYSDLFGTPSLSSVALSGKYSDLSGTPDLSVYALTTEMERLFQALNISQYAKTSELGELAFVDSLSKSDVGLGNVANETYAGGTAVTLNGFSKAKSTASFYAPTSAGTVGYFLKSQGAGDAPIWSALGALATKDSLTYSDVGVTKDVITSLIGTTTYAAYNANGYLPLSGGTIERTDTNSIPLILKSGNTAASALGFAIKNGSGTAYLAYYGGTDWRITKEQWGAEYTLIHSGNIGSQVVKGLIGTDGIVTATSGTSGRLSLNGRIYWNGDADWYSIGSYTETSGVPPFGRYIFYSGHIFKTASGEALRINSSGNVTIGASDLASTITNCKLYVDGRKLALKQDAAYEMQLYAQNSITKTGILVAAGGASGLYNYTKDYWIIVSEGEKIYLPSHNVGIGNPDPQYKLDVYGNAAFGTSAACDVFFRRSTGLSYIHAAHSFAITTNGDDTNIALQLQKDKSAYLWGTLTVSGAVTMSSTLSVNSVAQFTTYDIQFASNVFMNKGQEGIYITGTGITWHDASHAWKAGLVGFAADKITLGQAVSISSTLGVSGQATFESDIHVKGESAVGSDIRFKDIAEHKTLSLDTMANAPLFSFTWNDREDKALHLGTSAQYWEEAIPELVSGSDFKTLNYASLGVAMGISLAQEVKDLKAEVKRLKKEIDGIHSR